MMSSQSQISQVRNMNPIKSIHTKKLVPYEGNKLYFLLRFRIVYKLNKGSCRFRPAIYRSV